MLPTQPRGLLFSDWTVLTYLGQQVYFYSFKKRDHSFGIPASFRLLDLRVTLSFQLMEHMYSKQMYLTENLRYEQEKKRRLRTQPKEERPTYRSHRVFNIVNPRTDQSIVCLSLDFKVEMRCQARHSHRY